MKKAQPNRMASPTKNGHLDNFGASEFCMRETNTQRPSVIQGKDAEKLFFAIGREAEKSKLKLLEAIGFDRLYLTFSPHVLCCQTSYECEKDRSYWFTDKPSKRHTGSPSDPPLTLAELRN